MASGHGLPTPIAQMWLHIAFDVGAVERRQDLGSLPKGFFYPTGKHKNTPPLLRPTPALALTHHADKGADTPNIKAPSTRIQAEQRTPTEALTPWRQNILTTVAALLGKFHTNRTHTSAATKMVTSLPTRIGATGANAHHNRNGPPVPTPTSHTDAEVATLGGTEPATSTNKIPGVVTGIKRTKPTPNNDPPNNTGDGGTARAATPAGTASGSTGDGTGKSNRDGVNYAVASAAATAFLTASTIGEFNASQNPSPTQHNYKPPYVGGGAEVARAATRADSVTGGGGAGATVSSRDSAEYAAAGAAAAAFLTTSTEGRGNLFSHLSPMQRAQLVAELGATAAPATQASPAAMGTAIVPPTPNPTHLSTTHPCAQSHATATASMGGGTATAGSESDEDDIELLVPITSTAEGGWKTASRALFAEQSRQKATNALDFLKQSKRAASSAGGTKRAGVWVQMRIPLAKGCVSTAIPTTSEEEEIMDALIGAAQLPFEVDKVQHFCLDEAIMIGGTAHFIGFLLFSPEVTRAHEKQGFVFPSQQMAHLESALHALLSEDACYRNIPSMPLCIQQTKLRLPAVNSTSERTCFALQGLPPCFLLPKGGDDVLTFRHAAREIVLAVRSHHKMLNERVPTIITKASKNSHTAASIISLKNVRVSRGRGKGKGDNILMVAITGERSDGDAMIDALSAVTNTDIYIAGGHEIGIFPRALGAEKDRIQSLAVAWDRKLISSQRTIVREGVRLDQKAIARIAAITMLIPDCQGVLPILRHGRTNPSFNFLLQYTRTNVGLTAAAITAMIGAAHPELLPPVVTPSAPHLTGYGLASPQIDQTRRGSAEALAHSRHNPGRGGNPHSGQRRGRGGSTRGNFRKDTTSRIERRITASNRYHILVNPRNGIFWAGVYYGHWDDDNIKGMVNGASHSIHFSSDLEGDAYKRLAHYHPQCTSPEAVALMQNNCILTASNLNNPSLKVRERIGDYGHARIHGAEFTREHREEMDPEVYASRLDATRRMISQNKDHTPWASYDFVEPGDLPIAGGPPYANSTVTAQDSPGATPHPPVDTVGESTSMGEDGGEDAMSTLSHRTNDLSLAPFNSAKRFRGAEGQVVPRFTGAKLTIGIGTPLEAVGTAINGLLMQAGCPANSITFDGVESVPQNDAIKLVYVNFSDGQVATACLPRIHTVLPGSFPVPANHAPLQATVDDVDATPRRDNAAPLNCRVRTCPHWGYGQPCFLPNELGHGQAAAHGRTFHAELYASLPHDVLEAIGWYRCANPCNYLSYGCIERDAHNATCSVIHALTTPQPAAPAPCNNPTDPWATIRALCPPTRRDDLEVRIANGISVADVHSLLITWLSEAQAAPFAHGEH